MEDMYKTDSEIDFIKGLGTHNVRICFRFSRAEWLRKYIGVTTHERIIWDGIDKRACIEFAREELKAELSKHPMDGVICQL